MHEGSNASKLELDAKNFHQRLLKAEILLVHNAEMREKESWWEEGKGGENVLWQQTEDDVFWHS